MKSVSCLCVHFFVLYNIAAQQLPVTNYSPSNGALFAGANSIHQDKHGWMWFTSSYDVVRYDGHEFRIIPLATGVKMDFCYRILELNEELWVLSNPYPLKIAGDSLQQLHAKNLPPYISDNISVNGHQYFLTEHGLYEYTDIIFSTLIIDSTLSIDDGETLLAYNDSMLVSFQWSESLLVFDLARLRTRAYTMPVYDIHQNQSGQIFLLLAERGVYELNDILTTDLEIDTSLYASLSDPEAQLFELDAQGNLFIGVQDKYLLKVSPEKVITEFPESKGLPSLWFYTMHCDREGNVWIGFNNGLCKIRNTPWRRYTKEQGLYSNYTSFFLEEQDRLYIGTYNGLNVFADNRLQQVRQGDQPFMCRSMTVQAHFSTLPGMTRTHEDVRTQKIYFLRENKLLSAELDENDLQVRRERVLAELPGIGLYLAMDSIGTIFIATDVGLYSWYQGRLEKAIPGNTHYHNVFVDAHQKLWASAFGDVLEVYNIFFENGRCVLSALPMTDSVNKSFQEVKQVRSIAEDKNGNIYVGTRYNGLFHFTISGDQVSAVRRWTENNNLNSNSIWGVSVDVDGNCWIATARGLNQLDVENGTMSDEGASAQIYQSALVHAAQNNTIWVASHPGIMLLDKLPQPSFAFSLFITSVSVNGTPLRRQDERETTHHFPFTENNLQITFSANTFLDEEEVRYTYRLLQNDKPFGKPRSSGDWSIPGDLHSIQYPALQPGKYKFSVKAVNSSGIWSDNEAHVSFVIRPPFWQRAWFIFLAAVSLCVLVYTLYRYRIRQLMELQRMRNNISRNLHDDIGASLSNINILNALTLRNLPDPKKAESYLVQSSEDIQRISESLSDIVWNVNPMNDDPDQVYSHMKRYAADMLEGKNIQAHLDFPPPGSKAHLSMDKRRDFFLIFKEAINNMAKYSQATKAKIALHEEGNMLHLHIEDNGIGFDPVNVRAGNGLHNMRQRAENWGAGLEIESMLGKGTRIRLHMKTG